MDLDFLSFVDDTACGGIDPVVFQYYNQLINHRTIILNDEIGKQLIEMVYIPLKEFEEDSSTAPITLILNSLGGSVFDSFLLAHYLTTYKKKLNIIVTGYAASMATVILCAGGKNSNITRYCYPSTYGLIHDGFIELHTSESKTASDIMAFNDKVDQDIRTFILENTKISPELYDSKTRHQWFLSAADMKEFGIIDKILGSDE